MIIKIKLLFLKRSKNILNIKIDNIDKKSCHNIQLGDILLDKINKKEKDLYVCDKNLHEEITLVKSF